MPWGHLLTVCGVGYSSPATTGHVCSVGLTSDPTTPCSFASPQDGCTSLLMGRGRDRDCSAERSKLLTESSGCRGQRKLPLGSWRCGFQRGVCSEEKSQSCVNILVMTVPCLHRLNNSCILPLSPERRLQHLQAEPQS